LPCQTKTEEATDEAEEEEEEEEEEEDEEGWRVAWTSWVRKTFCMREASVLCVVWGGGGGKEGREGGRLAGTKKDACLSPGYHRSTSP